MRITNSISSVVMVCSLAGLSGCSSLVDKHIEYETVQPETFPVLRAVGYAPLSAQPGNTAGEKQLMAIKVSKLEAYRELAEQLYGQNLTSTITVKGAVAQNDGLKSQVNGLVRGAKVLKSYAVGDTYATELELDMKRVYDLYITQVKPQKIKKISYSFK
ncbi:flagellar biosynthesis protein FlgP [Pseudoalteromonas sp. L23]|uniref:LPP20 family lipoprotein n=1 Tax=unclassified Pseudoalteromonas TaxID=194690 RepID=UPI001F196363|nr:MULTISPECIES: flagellar biosynthesis protein FlgP [unclassified Pseudoalteromonas]MCF2827762.1 flagellar biosynthesis protein FlgP [Pseudoalteromonas sp. OF5H-5]MCF2831451.1 flagellar biosynthesis protein FlgP [Pseudoalteromonas sp. DL2-H6]MCF2925322.1 flagellar biosynthesis protein FlgP [Pseudoalteromonas sp. DL2-H1]MCF7514965.1 flagellar biosynthesis protein FlgP [Pseudoalteromonas sp. L7]MCF7527111.1 flagellar biosynthesis protein FlgP [Pseudoalteromonas sp. L23]